MATESCDVLIIGGGPAGSTCAWQLVKAGLDVVVLDKQTFPREKICAGWITPAVIESLAFDKKAYAHGRVLQPIHGFRTGIWGGAEVETHYRDKAASYGIRRFEFDHYLLERSKARLRLGEPMKSMTRDGDGWLVNGEIRTPLVIGAGGHFCPVSRQLGTQLGQGETIVSAQEIEFPLSAAQREECNFDNDVVQLYFCPDLKGYGWCFAKDNYLNVGLGREDNHRLSEHVERFCDWLRDRGSIPRNLPGKLKGHAYLTYPSSQRNLTADGVLLIGDAAGLAYPESGEGIRPAIESGLMAAEVILAAKKDYRQAQLEPYANSLTLRFGQRSTGNTGKSWVPAKLKQKIAASLMASHWFARNVVIERWFLHASQPAIVMGPAP
jgi:geranylgeranyl reductase family protein